MSKKIVIDTETTGFNAKTDELLQVSIIDTDGNVLFDSFFKPTRHSEWKEAENVNGISPEMVANSPTIDEKIAVINDILHSADEVIGYNTGFDIGFLESNGATFKAEYKVVDVMKLFAPVYGVWSDEPKDYLKLVDNLEAAKKKKKYLEEHPDEADDEEVGYLDDDIADWEEKLKEVREDWKPKKEPNMDEEIKLIKNWVKEREDFINK